MFSIITATKNAKNDISFLANSLMAQTSKNFIWIVVDGMSIDGTCEYLSNLKGINIIINSEEDFGIYDALNRGIKLCNTEYYLVLGADDKLNENAVAYVNDIISKENFDVLSCTINVNGKNRNKRNSIIWFGHKALISEHSVATVFKKDLHQKFGLYSNNYPIGADEFFSLKAYLGNSKFIYREFEMGTFGLNGVSSIKNLDVICQHTIIMIEVGYNSFLQLILLFFRMVKLIVMNKIKK